MASSVEKTIAVYEKTTGKIVHVHHDIVFSGAKGPSQAEFERNAMSAAMRTAGRNASEFTTLAIGPNALRRDRKYSIDLAKKKLRAINIAKE